MAVQQLAAALAARLPWLGRGHIGSLCDALATLGVDSQGWTAADVVEHLDASNAAAGLYQPSPDGQRNPVGLFLVQARRALVDVEPPVRRRRREAEQRAAQRAAAAAESAAERARVVALAADSEAQARIAAAKASIRAMLAARRPRHRR